MAVMWKNEKGNTCYGVNPATKKRKAKPKPKQEPKKEPEKEPETVKETEEKEG